MSAGRLIYAGLACVKQVNQQLTLVIYRIIILPNISHMQVVAHNHHHRVIPGGTLLQVAYEALDQLVGTVHGMKHRVINVVVGLAAPRKLTRRRMGVYCQYREVKW